MKNNTRKNYLRKLVEEFKVVWMKGDINEIDNFIENYSKSLKDFNYFVECLEKLPELFKKTVILLSDTHDGLFCYITENTVINGNYKLLKLCLEANKSLNHINVNYDYNGDDVKPILHRAVISGSIDCVKLLLEEGANPYLKDYKGRIPINYSKDEGITELLLSWMKKEQTSNKRDREDFEGSDKKEENTSSKRVKSEECCEELDSKQRDEQIEKRRLAAAAETHSQDITKFFKPQDKSPVGKHSERISKESEGKGKEKAL
ncbi:ankyrin repeat domain-containing protein [Candidatus Jidaibacter acanthamoebae]|nr:ankyrin repeat domain-containing protein [Candidatus Jidaibacter acanthamoeba]